MKTNKFELIRASLARRVGEPVYFKNTVAKVARNLGYEAPESELAKILANCAVHPDQFQLNTYKLGFNHSVVLYKESGVWNYLLDLQKEGKMDLKKQKIRSFQDIVARKLHRL